MIPWSEIFGAAGALLALGIGGEVVRRELAKRKPPAGPEQWQVEADEAARRRRELREKYGAPPSPL